MKILLLAPQPFFQNRGTPIAVRLLAETLGKAGQEVHLLVFHEGEDLAMPNVTLHRTAALPFLRAIPPGFSWQKICCDLLMTAKAIQMQRQLGFDLVHAVEESVFIAMLLRLLFKVPYIYDLDSWMSDQLIAKLTVLRPFRSLLESFEKAAVRHSLGVVPVCRAIEDKIRSFNRDKSLLRLEDISLLEEGNFCQKEDVRTLTGCQGKIVMYVGNLERYQGMTLFLEAFTLADPAALDCSLVIIGGVAKDIAYYTEMAQQLGISKRVFFIGPRPASALGMYLTQADLLVSPRTEGENTPMKIYSYMDSGKPILATKIASHTQVLDESNAFLALPEPAALAAELRRVLTDNSEASKRAAQAKEKAADYSRPAYERKINRFYSELMQEMIR
ncbi:MAG: Glycosyltransferase involved in cell wall bisynthesis [Candidatus Electronema aureum]|uniref:Glycosyltransferase involved in cell wall bisynthesis n=1 Tax=Candidatus Electronema aureum TaxID=2005002 RepID=A0A521G3S3_9BACT|nr:MAG: Glycosyltransferase involved in cell wall bisynthesis [Candidatus Electronema aureum]